MCVCVCRYARPLCSIDQGVHPPSIYRYKQCNSMQGHCARLTRGFISHIYIYQQCRSMKGICDQLTRGYHLPLIYIYIYVCVCVCVTGTKMGLGTRRRKTELNCTFITNGYLAWMPVGVQTTMAVLLHMCSGFPTKMGEQTIVTS